MPRPGARELRSNPVVTWFSNSCTNVMKSADSLDMLKKYPRKNGGQERRCSTEVKGLSGHNQIKRAPSWISNASLKTEIFREVPIVFGTLCFCKRANRNIYLEWIRFYLSQTTEHRCNWTLQIFSQIMFLSK